MIDIEQHVIHTTSRGCWGLVLIGETAFYLLPSRRWYYGWRLDVGTRQHRFRWQRSTLRRPLWPLLVTLTLVGLVLWYAGRH